MPTHVLVPVDDSDPAEQALECAVEEFPDATLTALHVVDPGKFVASKSIESAVTDADLQDAYTQHAESFLAEVREEVPVPESEFNTDYAVGKVPRSILDYVEEHDVDHVVMGSHGRTGASRVLLGSVAESVTRRSPVPVTVVR